MSAELYRLTPPFGGSTKNEGRNDMRLLLAIFLPWVLFFTIGRPMAGVICFPKFDTNY